MSGQPGGVRDQLGLQPPAQVVLDRTRPERPLEYLHPLLLLSGPIERPSELELSQRAALWVLEEARRFSQPREHCRGAQARLRRGQLEQQLGAVGTARRLLQRPPKVSGRASGRPSPRGLSGCRAQRRDRFLDALGRGVEKLAADLLHGSSSSGQDGRRLGMFLRALMWRAGLIDGVSNERMHEPQRRIGPQKIDPREDRSRGCLRPLLDPGQRGGMPAIGPVAKHGHGAGQRRRVRRQAREPELHRTRHGIRSEPLQHVH